MKRTSMFAALLATALLLLPAGGSAQAPDSPWCTPDSGCSLYFAGSAIGSYPAAGQLQIPATASAVSVTLISDSVSSAYTVNLETAALGASPSFTSCASGTLSTTAGSLTLTCGASGSTPWGYVKVVLSGGSAAGGFHGRIYAQGPGLANFNPQTLPTIAQCNGTTPPPCYIYLTGQTAAITGATLYTPPVSGEFRCTVSVWNTSTATGTATADCSYHQIIGQSGHAVTATANTASITINTVVGAFWQASGGSVLYDFSNSGTAPCNVLIVVEQLYA